MCFNRAFIQLDINQKKIGGRNQLAEWLNPNEKGFGSDVRCVFIAHTHIQSG